MITDLNILTAFIEGARISSIAALITDDPQRVEDALWRIAREMRDEQLRRALDDLAIRI